MQFGSEQQVCGSSDINPNFTSDASNRELTSHAAHRKPRTVYPGLLLCWLASKRKFSPLLTLFLPERKELSRSRMVSYGHGV
jgi:hypothetical protein